MKKISKLMTAALIALASFVPAQAETLNLYDGENWSALAPINSWGYDTNGSRTQVLYPASDLTAMVGKEIKAITFYTDENGCKNYNGMLSISMGETEATEMTDFVISGLTQVGTYTMVEHLDEAVEINITFDTPYLYQGGNLIFENVVIEAGHYDYTYFVGTEINYNNCVFTQFGTQLRGFLPKTTFTYEGGGEEGITRLSQANALEDNSEFTFNGDAVVTVCWNGYLFLRDESGYGQISGFDGTLVNGQVLNPEWTATKTSDDGWVKYIDAAGISASGETNDALAAAQKLTGAVDESMINAYVYVENVKLGTFPPRSITLPDGSTIAKTEILGGINWSMGGYYNVYGIICKVDGALKFNAVSCEEYVEPEPEVLRGDVNKDKVVNIADVTALIDMLLSGAEMIPEADCNLDNVMNIADVTALIDFLLSGTWPN